MLVIFITIYHLIYVLFIYDYSITKEIFSEFPYLFALFLISVFFASLFGWCKCQKIIFIVVPSVIAVLTYFFMYYWYIISRKDKKLPFHFNPMSLVILAGGIPLGIFVGSFFVRHSSLIMKGLTTKQFDSIRKNRIIRRDMETNYTSEYNSNFQENLTLRKKIYNVYLFLKKGKSPSLVMDHHLI